MYTSVILVLGAVGCAYAAFWLHTRRARNLLAGLPSYYNLPFIGAFHKFVGGGELIMQRLTEMSEIADEKKLPFLVWAGPMPVLMFNNGEDVKAVTNTFIEKPYYYNFGRLWLGNGLLTAPGPIWRHSVKYLANTFNNTIVEGYQEVFNAQSQILVNKLKGEVGKEPFNIMHKYLAFSTLETICQTALGVPRVTENIVTTEYYNAFNLTAQLLLKRGLNLLTHLDPVYRLTQAHRDINESVRIMHNVSESVITKRMKEWESKKKDSEPQTGTRFKSFLDILLELRESDSFYTPEQIKSEVATIILGGQETVASTVFFIMLLIGANPEVQEKLYAEMKEIFDDSKRPVQKEDLSKMTYCEAVIYETMRLYPPAPAIMRYADKDLKLRSFTIPKNTACAINVWGAGRSRRQWGPDVLQYRPERWLESDLMQKNSASFLAFSYGRRACIGKKYAMVYLKTVLAYCVRELHFTSQADKLTLSCELVLRTVSGNLLTVQLR